MVGVAGARGIHRLQTYGKGREVHRRSDDGEAREIRRDQVDGETREIHRRQTDDEAPTYDNKSYTISTTYHAGTLKMYSHHLGYHRRQTDGEARGTHIRQAHGEARGIHRRSYGEEAPTHDNRTYTISTTYHAGQLNLYSHHPGQPAQGTKTEPDITCIS